VVFENGSERDHSAARSEEAEDAEGVGHNGTALHSGTHTDGQDFSSTRLAGCTRSTSFDNARC
jgi:hypothetical protein